MWIASSECYVWIKARDLRAKINTARSTNICVYLRSQVEVNSDILHNLECLYHARPTQALACVYLNISTIF